MPALFYLATLKHAELSNAVFSTAAEFYELLFRHA
jgi:hypothetical protein